MGSDGGGDEVSLISLASPVLRNRYLILRVVGVVVLAVVTFTLLQPRTYTANASFIPQSRRPATSLSGLAGQFGLAIPLDEPSQSPAFYVDLVKSREILGAVVDTSYDIVTDTGAIRGTLVHLLRTGGRNEREKRDAAVKRLRQLVTVSAVQRTGVVNVSVKAQFAPLAEQVTSQIVDQLNRFNLHNRQTRAAAERRFTEQRLNDLKGELRQAEDQLESFLQRNRDYRNSPGLVFQQDRLARDVAMKQQVFTTLAQAYEQAKIDEVRDTPVITILERPELPIRPDRRGLIRRGLLALFVGGVLGVFVAFGREFLRNTAEERSEESLQFVVLKNEALGDLRHPLRTVGRLFSKP